MQWILQNICQILFARTENGRFIWPIGSNGKHSMKRMLKTMNFSLQNDYNSIWNDSYQTTSSLWRSFLSFQLNMNFDGHYEMIWSKYELKSEVVLSEFVPCSMSTARIETKLKTFKRFLMNFFSVFFSDILVHIDWDYFIPIFIIWFSVYFFSSLSFQFIHFSFFFSLFPL